MGKHSAQDKGKDRSIKKTKKKASRKEKRQKTQRQVNLPSMFPVMYPQGGAPAPSRGGPSDYESTSSQASLNSDDEEIKHKGGTCLSKLPKKRLVALVTHLQPAVDQVTAGEASIETLIRAVWCLTRSKPNTPLTLFRAKTWGQLWQQFAILAKSIKQ